MGHRLSKIYTRTGDDGTTGLGNGRRTNKDNARIEAIGAIDELNCSLAVVLVQELPSELRDCLIAIQHQLFDLGGELSIPGQSVIGEADVVHIEKLIERFNTDLPPLREFILPGGGKAAVHCHMARAICRRAERRMVTLQHQETVNPASSGFVNRLSDLLFVIARLLARAAGESEMFWRHDR